ncbi:hypothetical protein Zmor_021172 [Zophobas morio]|uniref:Peptidase S1 domain-containing protein n=1 Tax=Zophobas morio TaxID=2755281 RepID=A0AA38I4Q5_9CUCU|nr:hypothetical protein Zmor_021172 [Zophobas morio]
MFSLRFWLPFTLLLWENSIAALVSNKNIKPKIVNGDQASLGQFPWQVAINFFGEVETWWCGGVIISEQFILTAAHCGMTWEVLSSDVYSGFIDWENRGDSTFGVNFITYNDFNPQTMANDIALIEIIFPLEFNDNVKAIDLDSEVLGSDVNVTVSGWGQTTDDADLAPFLNYIILSTIDNSECDQIYGKGTIRDEMFCALPIGNVIQATCFGDSGGPAVVYQNGSPTLVGISSFISDRGCEKGDPSGFTRIANFREWIRSVTGV